MVMKCRRPSEPLGGQRWAGCKPLVGDAPASQSPRKHVRLNTLTATKCEVMVASHGCGVGKMPPLKQQRQKSGGHGGLPRPTQPHTTGPATRSLVPGRPKSPRGPGLPCPSRWPQAQPGTLGLWSGTPGLSRPVQPPRRGPQAGDGTQHRVTAGVGRLSAIPAQPSLSTQRHPPPPAGPHLHPTCLRPPPHSRPTLPAPQAPAPPLLAAPRPLSLLSNSQSHQAGHERSLLVGTLSPGPPCGEAHPDGTTWSRPCPGCLRSTCGGTVLRPATPHLSPLRTHSGSLDTWLQGAVPGQNRRSPGDRSGCTRCPWRPRHHGTEEAARLTAPRPPTATPFSPGGQGLVFSLTEAVARSEQGRAGGAWVPMSHRGRAACFCNKTWQSVWTLPCARSTPTSALWGLTASCPGCPRPRPRPRQSGIGMGSASTCGHRNHGNRGD